MNTTTATMTPDEARNILAESGLWAFERFTDRMGNTSINLNCRCELADNPNYLEVSDKYPPEIWQAARTLWPR